MQEKENSSRGSILQTKWKVKRIMTKKWAICSNVKKYFDGLTFYWNGFTLYKQDQVSRVRAGGASPILKSL
jgi:hypothetical protein